MPGPAAEWPGIVPRPAKLPGVRRWQVETTGPRRFNTVVAWSPDGRLIAMSDRPVLKLYDFDRRRVEHVLLGHTAEVVALAWKPDGKVLASASHDGTARLWTRDGQRTGIAMTGHGGLVRSIGWSPDGSVLATGGEDGTLRLWDAQGAPLSGGVIPGTAGPVLALAWSPDGKAIVTTHGDRTLRIRDARGVEQKTVGPLEHQVHSLAWGPDPNRLATTDGGGRLSLLSLPEGDLRLLGKIDASLHGLAWSPDRQSRTPIVTCSSAGGLQLWGLDGEPAVPLTDDWSYRSAAWSPDGSQVVAGALENREVRLWNTDDKTSEPLFDTAATVYDLAWDPSRRRLASVGSGHGLRIWDPLGHLLASATDLERNSGVVQWRADGRQLLTVSYFDNIRIWNPDEPSPRIAFKLNGTGFGVGWDPKGSTLAGVHGQNVQLWNADGSKRALLEGHEKEVISLAWSPDGGHLATGSRDRTVRVWSADGKLEHILKGHQADVEGALGWSADGSRLASGDHAGFLRIWSASGQLLSELHDSESGFLSRLAWNPKQPAQLATVSLDGRLRIWDANGAAPIRIEGPHRWESAPVWSPDGELVATATGGPHLGQVSDRTGRIVARLQGHELYENAVSWGPYDGEVTTGGVDQTIRIWNARTGELRCVTVNSGGGSWATFSAAGQLIGPAPKQAEETIRYVLQLDTGQLLTLTPSEFARRYPSPPISFDADRRAAEWALGLGSDGNGVDVVPEGGEATLPVRKREDLPKVPYRVVAIDRWGYSNVTAEGLRALEGLGHIRGLMLYGTKIGDEAMDTLGDLKSLEALNLGSTRVGDRGITLLAGLPNLVNLDLMHTKITDRGLGKLTGCKSIRTLTLDGCQITAEGLRQLNQLPELRQLWLGQIPLRDEDLTALQGLDRLERLRLNQTEISGPTVERIGREGRQLTELYLGSPHVDDRSIPALVGCSKLSVLSLDGCPVSDESMATIAKLSSLQILSLRGTRVGDAGLAALAPLGLTQLNLEGTPTSRAARQAFRRSHPGCQVFPTDPEP